jgi:hypothetical protein
MCLCIQTAFTGTRIKSPTMPGFQLLPTSLYMLT